MAFTGKAVQTTGLEAEGALVLLVDSANFTDVPADQTDKASTITDSNILFFGNTEYQTAKTPISEEEAVRDAFGNNVSMSHNLEGEGVVLGNLTKQERQDLREGNWTVLIADPVDVAALTNFSKSATNMNGMTGSFTAFEIYDNVKITFDGGREYNTTRKTAFKFSKIMKEETDDAYDDVEVTLSA